MSCTNYPKFALKTCVNSVQSARYINVSAVFCFIFLVFDILLHKVVVLEIEKSIHENELCIASSAFGNDDYMSLGMGSIGILCIGIIHETVICVLRINIMLKGKFATLCKPVKTVLFNLFVNKMNDDYLKSID